MSARDAIFGRVPRYLPALLIVAACGDSGTDSGAAELPLLDLTEELRIGSLDDPEYSFGWFTGLDIGPDGNIYTLHYKAQNIRVHDGSGRLVRTIGGKGEGPGEFSNARSFGFLGDTLWVFDRGRLSYFDVGTGELIRTDRIPIDLGSDPTDSPPRPVGLLADGNLLASTRTASRLVASGEITERRMFRWTRDSEPIDTLAVIPLANTTWEVAPPEGGFRSFMSQPFSDTELVRLSRGRPEIVRVDRSLPAEEEAVRYGVTKLTFDGDTLFDRWFDYDLMSLPDAVVDSLVDMRAKGMSERTDFARAEVAEWARQSLYAPEFFPPVETVVIGMDGSVWLQLADDGVGPLTWLGLAPDGAPLGELDAPRAFRLMQATVDRWWGSLSDELDVPYIVRYAVGPIPVPTEGSG